MPRQPGSYSSTCYALRSPAAGCYIAVHAWAYEMDNSDYQLRSISFSPRPISIGRSIKTARRMRDLLTPAALRPFIDQQQLEADAALQRLDHVRQAAATASYSINIDYHQEDYNRRLQLVERTKLAAMAPIEIVAIVTETNITESIVV